MTRRELLGGAALAAAAGRAAWAEGGFKATVVNHFEYLTDDYKRIRDWYVDLFGMTVSLDDGNQAYCWFGDTIFIPRKPRGAEVAPSIGHVGYTIEAYNHEQVRAELKRRGLTEVSSSGGPLTAPRAGVPPSPIANLNVHIKDPEGFVVQICSKDLVKKPELTGKVNAFRAIGVNHISYASADYDKARAFYSDLFGMQVTVNDGRQAYCRFGEAIFLPRRRSGQERTPYIDHIAYTIENYDHARVKAELKKRGLEEVGPTGGPLQPPRAGAPESPIANLSVHIKDPDGFLVQICSKDITRIAEKNPPEE